MLCFLSALRVKCPAGKAPCGHIACVDKMGGIQMDGRVLGFCIWSLCGLFFIGMGVYNIFSKTTRPFGFWANADTIPVEPDKIRAYNRALGKLWIMAGILFILIGLPLLICGQNSPWVMIPILGAMLEAIFLMIIYVLAIEKKYRKR